MSKFHVGDTVRFTRGTFKGDLATVTEVDVPDELDPDDPNKIQLGVVHGKKFTVHFPESIFEFVSEPSMFEKVMMGLPMESHGNPIVEDDEPFSEMALIGRYQPSKGKRSMSIAVDDERSHNSNRPYFKVFNNQDRTQASEMARLHFKDDGTERHSGGKSRDKQPPWIMKSSDINNLIEFMRMPNRTAENYTNWQVSCYEWNSVNGLLTSNETLKDYIAGKYDSRFTGDHRYVPSTQEMPKTWDMNKVGTKRKDE